MMNKVRHILVLMLMLTLYSCTSESEKILTEKIDSEEFNFIEFNMEADGISYNMKDNIQYGLIHLVNGEQVKFWFLTHHATSDIGGTFYEYPDGERQFCSGLHCCEVQFYDKGKLGMRFKDVAELKNFVTENDGKRP